MNTSDQAAPHSRALSHLPTLDGLRGIAVLLVMLHHFTLVGDLHPTSRLETAYYQLTYLGWSGVHLFFVLSGFLITRILMAAKGSDHFVRNFYIRRALRIFPLYYGVLVLLFVALPGLTPLADQFRLPARDQLWYWSYGVNVLVALKGWHAYSLTSLHHFWSLAVEEQFYLIWPWLVVALDRRALKLVCVWSVVLSCLLRLALVLNDVVTAAYVLTPARMDTLMIGAWLALAAAEPAAMQRIVPRARHIARFTAIALLIMFVWRRGLASEDVVVLTLGYSLLAGLCGALLVIAVAAQSRSWCYTILTAPLLKRFGLYSYALYVFHQPIAFVLKHRFELDTLFPAFSSRLPAQLAFSVIAGLLSLAVAVVSWHAYEKHFLRLKVWFEADSRHPHVPLVHDSDTPRTTTASPSDLRADRRDVVHAP